MSVLVYTENWDGKFKKLSFELVSYASAIAKGLGKEVTVLSIGELAEEELNKLAGYGASKILSIQSEAYKIFASDTYSKAIAEVAQKENAEVLIFANNITTRVSASANFDFLNFILAFSKRSPTAPSANLFSTSNNNSAASLSLGYAFTYLEIKRLASI